MDSNVSIRIPKLGTNEFVEIFPDELPHDENVDYNDLMDVLKSELAPLKVWRACAVIAKMRFITGFYALTFLQSTFFQVEYHRQGFHSEFDVILDDLVDSLKDEGKLKLLYLGESLNN